VMAVWPKQGDSQRAIEALSSAPICRFAILVSRKRSLAINRLERDYRPGRARPCWRWSSRWPFDLFGFILSGGSALTAIIWKRVGDASQEAIKRTGCASMGADGQRSILARRTFRGMATLAADMVRQGACRPLSRENAEVGRASRANDWMMQWNAMNPRGLNKAA